MTRWADDDNTAPWDDDRLFVRCAGCGDLVTVSLDEPVAQDPLVCGACQAVDDERAEAHARQVS